MASKMMIFAVFCCLFWDILADGGCNMNEIPLDPNFNENLLLGQWIGYRWWRGPYQPDMVLDFQRGRDGNVLLYEYYRDYPEGPCIPFPVLTIYKVGEPGQYNVGAEIGGKRARVMHMSNNYFIFFLCHEYVEDECLDPDFEIYYRKGHKVKEEKAVELYTPLLHKACVDPNAMIEVHATGPCLVDAPKGKGKGGRGNDGD